MQPWHRWREPLAVGLLVVLGLMLVLRVASLILAVLAGTTGGLFGALPGGDDLLVLMAAAAVLWCATPVRDDGPADEPAAPSPHAWPVVVAGSVIIGLTVLGWLVLAILNVLTIGVSQGTETGFLLFVIDGLLRLAVPVAALVAVVLAVRRVAAARRATHGRPALSTAAAASEDPPAVTAAPERLPAAWQADEATGAVWLTADDAAQGHPGLSWSDPSATAGAVSSGPWAPPPAAAEEPVTRAPAAAPAATEDDDLR